jgi:hypothetical protein
VIAAVGGFLVLAAVSDRLRQPEAGVAPPIVSSPTTSGASSVLLRGGAGHVSVQEHVELLDRPVTASPRDPAALPSSPAVVGHPEIFTPEQIGYFIEVALGSEFGRGPGVVRKWQGPIRIQVHGSPTAEDRAALQAVMEELNQLTEGIELQLTDSDPSMEIFFVPEAEFARHEPRYQPVNLGFFWANWGADHQIVSARVLISTTGVTQQERAHLIREEVTQSLGLMQDSRRHRDSIFFQGWTDVVNYTEIDRAIIQLLYRPEIRAGMNASQVRAALRTRAAVPGAGVAPQLLPLP